MSTDAAIDLELDDTTADAPAIIEARGYQEDAVGAIFKRWRNDQSTLLILPTGCGKTIVAGMVAHKIKDDLGERILFLAHREELINQAAAKFLRLGLDCQIEMAEQKAARHNDLTGVSDVVIGTVQSIQGRRLASWRPDAFGLIITDEAHHGRAKTYKAIYKHFPDAKHLGITATPDRGDGKNLGALYESIAYEYSLRQAITEGYLVELKTARLYTDVCLQGLKSTGGDFADGDLAERISPAIEVLADAMRQEIGNRPTVVFLPDVGCAEMMADALRKKGIAASDISGRMPKKRRRQVLAEFHAGDHQVLCCCDLLTEGWDCPKVSCIVICRPTRKRSRYAQMVGRGTRPDLQSGKENLLIVDFAWETTSGHELCTAFDLFDDSSLDEDVLHEANQKCKTCTSTDLMEALAEAERTVRDRKLKATVTGRTAKYSRIIFDPVGVSAIMKIPVRQSIDYGGHAASPRQLDFLRDLGVTDNIERLSSIGASRRIAYLEQRRRAGLATVKQVALLQCLGVNQDHSLTLEKRDASDLIDLLRKRRP